MLTEVSYREAFLMSMNNYKTFLMNKMDKDEEKAEEVIMDLVTSELTYDFFEELETLANQLAEVNEDLQEEIKKRDEIERRRYIHERY